MKTSNPRFRGVIYQVMAKCVMVHICKEGGEVEDRQQVPAMVPLSATFSRDMFRLEPKVGSLFDMSLLRRRAKLWPDEHRLDLYKLPAKAAKRGWWVELFHYARPGTYVSIDEFPGSVEVNVVKSRVIPPTTCLAGFKSLKQAREFCQLNQLNVYRV